MTLGAGVGGFEGVGGCTPGAGEGGLTPGAGEGGLTPGAGDGGLTPGAGEGGLIPGPTGGTGGVPELPLVASNNIRGLAPARPKLLPVLRCAIVGRVRG